MRGVPSQLSLALGPRHFTLALSNMQQVWKNQ